MTSANSQLRDMALGNASKPQKRRAGSVVDGSIAQLPRGSSTLELVTEEDSVFHKSRNKKNGAL